MSIDFSDLDDVNLDNYGSRAPRQAAPAKTFPCLSCAGTGRYLGARVHQEQSQCFVCKGTGQHNKPHFEVVQAKAQRKEKLAATAERKAQEACNALPAGIWEFLVKNSDWSEFFRSLRDQVNGGKRLSDNQVAAIDRSRAKIASKREEKQASRTSVVDLTAIEKLFDKARESGLTKLVYRANGLVLSPAKSHSVNAGSIYVKTKGGEYLGKVTNNKFICTGAATQEHKDTLTAVAADPAGEAKAYGKATGECCCCGRELSDPASVAAGIGPVCAEKWFGA